MTVIPDESDEIRGAALLSRQGRWQEAGAKLERLATASEGRDLARARLAQVDGWCVEDYKKGLVPGRDKHAALAQVEPLIERLDDDALRAELHYQRGTALHQQFIMETGEPVAWERDSFARAAALYARVGDQEGAALATAMVGIYHHVDLLDRAAAEPILWRAYAAAPEDGRSYARSEASRHLGQIRQELGRPSDALPLLEESLALREGSGFEVFVSSGVHAIASAKLDAGDLDGAESDLRRAREEAEGYDGTLTLALIAATEAALSQARVMPGVWQRSHP